RRGGLARVVLRDPDQGGPIAMAPGDVGRRLVSGPQPFVGVHVLIGHCRDLRRMREQSGDELTSGPRQLVLRPGSKNALFSPSNSDTCVCMPLPGWVASGLGMKEAYTPCEIATSLITERKVMTLSAIVRASA